MSLKPDIRYLKPDPGQRIIECRWISQVGSWWVVVAYTALVIRWAAVTSATLS
ncbi:MAG: hypothetical protein HON70_32920 [Lentisphaerae bacterium]|nr:hypothetical protein [Lentisphaerota bacterium]